MIGDSNREFFAQVVIVAAVCVGGWMMFAGNAAERVASLRTQTEEAAASLSAVSGQSVEQLALRIVSESARVDQIRRRNALARNSTALYRAMSAAARECGVHVDSLRPAEWIEREIDSVTVESSQIDLLCSGTFEQAAAFLDAVDDIDAFLRLSHVQLLPIGTRENPRVTLQFECEVFAFQLPDRVAQP